MPHESSTLYLDNTSVKPLSQKDKLSDNSCYSKPQVIKVKWVYLLGLIGWIVLIFLYRLVPPMDGVETAILLLPVIVFTVSYMNIPTVTYSVEKYMFKANLLTLGLLVVLPLLTWVNARFNKNRALFIKLAATAIIFSMITLIDVWIPHDYLPVVKHIKSVLQTTAITLLIFGLYRFFIEHSQEITEQSRLILKK